MKIEPITLSEQKQVQLRKWLDDSASVVFLDVLLAAAFENEGKSANCLLEGKTGFDNEAKEFTRVANVYHSMIDEFNKLRESKEKFKVFVAKPSPKSQTPTQ